MNKIINNKRFKHYLRDPAAVIGSIVCVLMFAAAIFAPFIAPQNPYDLTSLSYADRLKPPIWMEGGQAPFLLGTEHAGRGIFSSILYGLRVSLGVGFGVVILAGTIGSVIGLLAGFYRGWFDTVSMRLADTLFSFSTTLLAILILGITQHKGIITIILAITLANWVRYARITRGNVLSVAEEEYIIAAKAIGASGLRIIFKHILPNVIASIFVIAAIDLGIVIMVEATLSFLGIGVPLTEPSLGMMISQGREYLYAGKWWLIVFPGVALGSIVIAINLFADWLREEFNPKLN